MNYRNLLLTWIVSLSSPWLYAQHETDLIRLEYVFEGASLVGNNRYSVLNAVTTTTGLYRIIANYAHPIGHGGIEALYNVTYCHLHQTQDVSGVAQSAMLLKVPERYYRQPDFSRFSFLGGVSKSLGHNWKGYSIFSLSMTDDLGHPELSATFLWGSLTYVEKEADDRLSYGLGLFLSQLENRLLVTPAVNVRIQNHRRGIEVRFPDRIRGWQNLAGASYLEVNAVTDTYSLTYKAPEKVATTDIYRLTAGITYNYLWQDFLKLFVSINLPLSYHTLYTGGQVLDRVQQHGVGGSMGASLFVSDHE